MKVDASSIYLETPLNPSVSRTHCWRALLNYYSLALFARRDDFVLLHFYFYAGCDEFVGQVGNLRPIVNRPRRLRTAASRRVANPPQHAILPHIPLSCRTPVA
jgi:hypothetical protein